MSDLKEKLQALQIDFDEIKNILQAHELLGLSVEAQKAADRVIRLAEVSPAMSLLFR